MASVRRTAVRDAVVRMVIAFCGCLLLAGPAAAFEVVKAGGPAARLLILGLGGTEQACGSAVLPAGDGVLRFDPEAVDCGAISQFVVIVRAPDAGEDSFRGEWCEAIVARGGTLRLEPTSDGAGGVADLGPPMACTLTPPAD